MEQIGLNPVIMPSDVEEKITSDNPAQVVMELSKQKAENVAEKCSKTGPSWVVVGSDTVVAADGKILGKPGDREEAVRMIALLQGRSHHVYTGVTLVSENRTVTFAEETKVHVYPMTQEEIEGYVAAGESMDKAGAYGIQGRFAAYIRGIEGSYTNVMGLPAGRLYQELKKFQEESDD